jgi:ornithine decarboxylase
MDEPVPLTAFHATSLQLPASWPSTLHPDVLTAMPGPTPFLVGDLSTVSDRYARLMTELPNATCFYAPKCNISEPIIQTLAGLGSHFEVASWGELEQLIAFGVNPADVLYSNTVKPASHIAKTYEAGLWRYAFDTESELYKIAKHAPGAAVYVRLRVDDSSSVFPLSRKFGTEAAMARDLLLLARELGLVAYGVTFHVGSQCRSPRAWRQAIAATGRLMRRLEGDGVQLPMLNLGGGLPARYTDAVPTIEEFGATIRAALTDLIPYRPELLAIEPGRHLVAESSVLVASVLAREERAGEEWLHLDVGAYNGLMETQQTANSWSFPLWTSRRDHATAYQIPFTVTGPSCDSSDTMFVAAPLPATLSVDDRVYIGSAGAYTLSYASSFNGFPPPRTVFVGGS